MEEKKKTVQGKDATIVKKRQRQLGQDFEGRPESERPRRPEGRPWRQQKQELLRMDIDDLRDYLLDSEM
jgi:hypothetical protein